MDLSIIVVSYNNRDLTQRCLESIIQQTVSLEYEIIVVDNASQDGSPEMVREKFPFVKLIRHSKNVGFAAGQNSGLKESKGQFLLILNNDVLFVGNAAKQLVDFLRNSDASVGVVGPQILNPDGTVAPSARRSLYSRQMIALSIINRHFNLKRFLPSESFLRKYLGVLLSRCHDNFFTHNQIKEAEFVDGMCYLIKRIVLEQVGLFDEQFFFDYEIVDLSNRVRAKGWKIVFFPGARVFHNTGSTRKKFSRIILETHRSELIYYSKYDSSHSTFIRKADLIILGLKGFLLRLSIFLSRNKKIQREKLMLNREIIAVCKAFDSTSVWLNERIPFLPNL